MHIGYKYRYHCTIQQNSSVCQLSDTAEERDLESMVTDNLGASVQSAETEKAMKVLGMIHRQFKDIYKYKYVMGVGIGTRKWRN